MPSSVSLDISEVLKANDELVNKQLPFAVARALTETAKDAQAEIRRQMKSRFILRNEWTQRGIIIQPADKNRIPWTSAVMVGDLWAYLFQQETGGLKVPTSSRHLAIPEDVRSSPRQILVKALRPKALLQRKDVFIKDLGGGAQAIFQRLPDRKLRLLYLLDPSAKIKPRLGLVDTARLVAERNWVVNFNASLQLALETAR